MVARQLQRVQTFFVKKVQITSQKKNTSFNSAKVSPTWVNSAKVVPTWFNSANVVFRWFKPFNSELKKFKRTYFLVRHPILRNFRTFSWKCQDLSFRLDSYFPFPKAYGCRRVMTSSYGQNPSSCCPRLMYNNKVVQTKRTYSSNFENDHL